MQTVASCNVKITLIKAHSIILIKAHKPNTHTPIKSHYSINIKQDYYCYLTGAERVGWVSSSELSVDDSLSDPPVAKKRDIVITCEGETISTISHT